jgi:hypothetical protein
MALLVRKICNTNDVDRDLDDFNATATAPWLRIADAPLSTVVTNVIALYAAVLCA